MLLRAVPGLRRVNLQLLVKEHETFSVPCLCFSSVPAFASVPSPPAAGAQASIAPSLEAVKMVSSPTGVTWEQQALSQYRRQAKAGF